MCFLSHDINYYYILLIVFILQIYLQEDSSEETYEIAERINNALKLQNLFSLSKNCKVLFTKKFILLLINLMSILIFF